MAFEYTPHAKQAAAHKAFIVDGYDRGTLFWGRQVGKSLWSVKHLEIAATYRQGPYHIVFNTHKHAKDVMWKQYLHTIPPAMIYDTNSTDLEITFHYMKGAFAIPGLGWQAIKHDFEKQRSTLQLLGSDYADDHRGKFSYGMIFDEYQDQNPANFAAVYKYFFTTTRGWACFMGTAKGYNHWWELLEYAKQKKNTRWFYLEATWRDNPLVTQEWYDQERAEAEERDELDIFMQEVELQFRTVYGSVYKKFDRNIHVLEPDDKRIPDDGTHYVTWDFGWSEGHPTAINFVTVGYDGKRYCWDEIHGYELEVEDLCSMIKQKMGDKRLTLVIADSARPDLIAQAQKYLSVYGQPKPQGSVVSGIVMLATKLRPKIQLVGEPEPDYYFTANCKHTIYQMENYKYHEAKENRPQSEEPIKKDDDHPDGLRYLELYLKHGPRDKKKVPAQKPKFNSYGLMPNGI